MIRPKAIEMKPRSAPENGAFVPLSSSRIAGTEPAPMKTSSAVPMNSANRRCETWCSAIALDLLSAQGRGAAGRSAGFPKRECLGAIFDIIEHRSATIEHFDRLCQAERTVKALKRPHPCVNTIRYDPGARVESFNVRS